ncbi:DUF2541 family protein [Photobacterium japonica]|uniref:DUF2541 family protein n=1 Tax=Photobacterium japonica TaxID=2910235 RepID=UPI003D14676D
MKTKTFIATLLVGASLLGTAGLAHADDKITLGRTIVFEHHSKDAVIPLMVCRRADAIQVKAERDMRLERVVATFRNGETKTIRFHRNLDKNERTDWRKFAYTRCIKKLEVFGKSKGSSAGVKIYGRK